MYLRRLLAVAFLAAAAAHCSKAAAPAQPLECRMEAVHPLVAGGPVALRFRLVNRTDAPLWVLRWNTPIEGWRGTIFTVSFQGTALPYKGPMIKRGDPGRQEYVEITPQDSLNVSLDLAEAYDVKRPGRYQVRVTGRLYDVLKNAAEVPRPRHKQQPMALQCEPLVLEVEKAAS